jgi:hypothetical protein
LAESLWVTTLYGQDNEIPMVQIEFPIKTKVPGKIQLDLESAKAFALSIEEAIQASATDGFLIEFLRKQLELKDPQVWGVIRDFREWREAKIARAPKEILDKLQREQHD